MSLTSKRWNCKLAASLLLIKVIYLGSLKLIDDCPNSRHQKSEAKHLDPNYCGECGGAPAPANAVKAGCCNTCDEVREAYAQKSWSFKKGENIEQCQREGYGERINAQRKEGCRIEGVIQVNKVIGNFHVAPGRSFTNGNAHLHDLENYIDVLDLPPDERYTMTHEIHQLRFGPQLPDELSERWQWTDHHHTNPLDETKQDTNEPAFNFMYFIKVVSTSYLPLGWDSSSSHAAAQDAGSTALGSHGISSRSIETHQYSVTSHKRSVLGGNDAAEGHRERLHAQGGIPAVFFNYDISPMKVVNREVRAKTFTGFLTGVCAIIGGTLTVAAAVDRGLYEGVMRVKKMHTT